MPPKLPYRTPYYHPDDASYLLFEAGSAFYLSLSDKSVCRVLERFNRAGRDYQKFVAAYPDICCEPLAPFYLYRKATGMLDEHLLCDLLFSGAWQEANWGAWLAALAPQPMYAAHLSRRLPTLAHGRTVLRLALGACGETLPQELEACSAALDEVRETLARLPAQPAPLRLYPSPEHLRACHRERLAISAAYRAGGLEAAKPLIGQGLAGYYNMTHAEWLAAGAPEAPTVPHLRQLRHRVLPRF
ncbi:hypothetical protein [Massilia aquatica]|uniref:Uncharacterized protein n=1 Tax=Massilia aquatica TaxID=2609000 RepID=A0ABX0M511_9BURK|nr:hypothetical protein [Massilia aquatica]NHZ39347.1 hypothetical protein [Massilia aquatica]